MADDGSFVIAGQSSGNFTGIDSIDVELESNFAAIKLDSEGDEVWRWQVRSYSTVVATRHAAPLLVSCQLYSETPCDPLFVCLASIAWR